MAKALGYASTAGIGNIISRNEYLKQPEFSGTYKLSVPQGCGTSIQETRIFTEDGIYEVSMLVKEIASIHGKELKHINEAINSNRQRFIDGVDILDIKGSEFAVGLVDSEVYTRNSMNASKNVYLLSDRGYSKLLKILEDDIAWKEN